MVKIIDARKIGSEEVVAQLRRPGGFLSPEVRGSARRILRDVRVRGDEALAEYTERFDGVRPERFRISGKEVESSRASL
ncbi:MAG: histidinol dehydrogenase, partial [Rubrobacteraceae bacterium]